MYVDVHLKMKSFNKVFVISILLQYMSPICFGMDLPCNTSSPDVFCKEKEPSNHSTYQCYNSKCCLSLWKDWSNSFTFVTQSDVEVVITPFNKIFDSSSHIAYNISFIIKDERIWSASFRLSDCYDAPYTQFQCRYYIFSSPYQSAIRTIHNDEFFFLNSKRCIIEAIALNENETPLFYQKLLTNIPLSVESGNTIDFSTWQSLVVVDVTKHEHFQPIYFTTVPQKFNISSYKIRLVENNVSQEWKTVTVPVDSSYVKTYVGPIYENNKYSVELSLEREGNTTRDCCLSSSADFNFKKDKGSSWVIALYVILSLAAIVIFFLIFFWKRWVNKRVSFDAGFVKVFIAYSYDIPEHSEVVLDFAMYLKTFCYCNVLLDVHDIKNKDPDVWITDSIESADFVLIIWSRGAHLKFSKDNTKIFKNEPGYLGEDLFSNAMTKITAKLAQEMRTPKRHRHLGKYINILPSYAPNTVPSQLNYLPCFHIPGEFNSFLYFLHSDRSTKCLFTSSSFCNRITSFFNCYPKFHISNLSSNFQGRELLNAMHQMHQLEKRDPDWLDKLVVEDIPSSLPSNRIAKEGADKEEERSVNSLKMELGHHECSGDDDEDNESTKMNNFPPNVHELPIFGPAASHSARSFWPPPENNCTDSDNDCDLPPDIFAPALSLHR